MKRRETWNDLQFWKGENWRTLRHILKEYPSEIAPDKKVVFRPLIETPLHTVRCVFVLPEPYAYDDQADGLAISHKQKDKTPFLYRAFMDELSILAVKPRKGDLRRWTRNGVLLWNATPTVLKNTPGSHRNLGWSELTREILETCYLVNPKTVFVFCGTVNLAEILPEDANKICLPIPVLGPRNPFSGCHVFNRVNSILRAQRQNRINWAV